jgi:DNA polymerase iota
VENRQPALKTKPLGIRQKGILATCNYVARRRGVGKLTTLVEAKRLCPDLVIVDGEDLSPFRDVSKRLYALLRSYSWSGKVERLGLDEVFLDVTDIISYNLELLNRNSLAHSYFCLSRTDPEQGFEFDATSFSGCLQGNAREADAARGDVLSDTLYMRLLLASHLARYLRLKIEDEGYTTTCGISTNKLLAKLVGNKNKPQSQTTLLALNEDDVFAFMDEHGLRKVPGIGSKITHTLEGFVLGKEIKEDFHSMECSVSVGQVRTHPLIQNPSVLDNLLGGRGSERGLPGKVWALLHGIDDTEVKPARDVPTQISIEDTYKGLNNSSEISREMSFIAASLLRRMHIDLLDDDAPTAQNQTQAATQTPLPSTKRWLACPRTIRLTTRPYTSPTDGKPYNWARTSRSAPLPSFVFNQSMSSEEIVEKLVVETLLPLFFKLNPAPKGWNTGLINVCVTNMAGPAVSQGWVRDIGAMFRRQDDVLREFTVYDNGGAPSFEREGAQEEKGPEVVVVDVGCGLRGEQGGGMEVGDVHLAEAGGDGEGRGLDEDQVFESDGAWDEYRGQTSSQEEGSERCPLCRRFLPVFALAAHERYHSMEMDGN